MNVIFTPTAWQQYTEWQNDDKKIVKRINAVIFAIVCILFVHAYQISRKPPFYRICRF